MAAPAITCCVAAHWGAYRAPAWAGGDIPGRLGDLIHEDPGGRAWQWPQALGGLCGSFRITWWGWLVPVTKFQSENGWSGSCVLISQWLLPASRDPLLRHVGSSDHPDCVQDTLSGCHVTVLDNLDGS